MHGGKIFNLSDAVSLSDAVNLGLLIKIINFSAYIIEKDLTDAIIELRREIHNIRKEKVTTTEVEERLNSIEGTLKRNWRYALHVKGGSAMSEKDLTSICSLIGLNKEVALLFNKHHE